MRFGKSWFNYHTLIDGYNAKSRSVQEKLQKPSIGRSALFHCFQRIVTRASINRASSRSHDLFAFYASYYAMCSRRQHHHQPSANLTIHAIILCTCAMGIGRSCADPLLESFRPLLPYPSRNVTAQPTLQPTAFSKPTILPTRDMYDQLSIVYSRMPGL